MRAQVAQCGSYDIINIHSTCVCSKIPQFICLILGNIRRYGPLYSTDNMSACVTLVRHNTNISTFGVRFALRGLRLNTDNTDGDRGLISACSIKSHQVRSIVFKVCDIHREESILVPNPFSQTN